MFPQKIIIGLLAAALSGATFAADASNVQLGTVRGYLFGTDWTSLGSSQTYIKANGSTKIADFEILRPPYEESVVELEVVKYPNKGWTLDYWMRAMWSGYDVDWTVGDSLKWIGTDGKTKVVYTHGEVGGGYVDFAVKFKYLTYEIEYDSDGGSYVGGLNNLVYTDKVSIASAPTRTGYTFQNWKTPNGTTFAAGRSNLTGASFKELDNVHTNGYKLKLTAQWEPIYHTVVFTNEYAKTVVDIQQVLEGSDATPPATKPTCDGYDFVDWGGDSYNNVTEDRLVTANFTANHYFIVYHSDNDNSSERHECTYGQPVHIVETQLNFSRVGYVFAGWRREGDARVYSPGEQVINLTAEKLGEVHFYAVWRPITYTIAFDAAGGEGEMETIDVEYDQEVELPSCSFIKVGCEFVQWATTVDGVATNFVDGATVSNLTAVAAATNTLSVVWLGHYSVAFNSNGGDGEMANMDCVRNQEYSLSPNRFTKTGYTFVGWAVSADRADALNVDYEDGATIDNFADAGETGELFAVWNPNRYSVVFNSNGGTGEMAPQEFVYDQPQPLSPNVFVRSEVWAFGGWSNVVDGVVYFYSDQEEVCNLTPVDGGVVQLNAVWQSVLGELSEAMGCDNLIWSNKVSSGSAWIASDTPIRCVKGYGSGAIMRSSAITTNGTLRFRWKSTSSGISVQNVFLYSANSLHSDAVNDSATLKEVWNGVADWQTVELRITITPNKVNWIEFYYSDFGDGECYIADLTWIPDGADESAATEYVADDTQISTFTTTTDGRLSFAFDGEGGVQYHLLGTNILSAPMPWPVVFTTNDIGRIVIEVPMDDASSQMFYRIRAVK